MPIKRLISFSLNDELFSYVLLIPFISGYFIYTKRNVIFANKKYSYITGTTTIILGIIFHFMGINQQMGFEQNDYLFITVSSAMIFWTGGFVFVFLVIHINT
ncbi:MAG: hypothetical protein AAB257_08285, partial [Nitrospinota bacterium]